MICFQDLGFRVWGPWFGFESFRHRFPPKANAGFTLQGQKRQSMPHHPSLGFRVYTLIHASSPCSTSPGGFRSKQREFSRTASRNPHSPETTCRFLRCTEAGSCRVIAAKPPGPQILGSLQNVDITSEDSTARLILFNSGVPARVKQEGARCHHGVYGCILESQFPVQRR
jgi:hypothetical protein